MWWTVSFLLLIMWWAGLVTAQTVGGLIHVFLFLILVFLVANLMRDHA